MTNRQYYMAAALAGTATTPLNPDYPYEETAQDLASHAFLIAQAACDADGIHPNDPILLSIENTRP